MAGRNTGYELEGMFSNPDERSQRNYETDDRLFALGFWQKRVFAATVDQFLGFLQLSYRSVCLLPVLADAVVVIDEVHSFDHRLWTALKTLLKEFRLPVLCMTASLPSPRRLELEQLALKPYPGPGRQFEDLVRSAQLRRYRIHAIPDESAARAIAQTALTEGKRVLWVVNTVDRCQRLARDFEQLGVLCYHSRFTLRDRKERHTAVVAAFQPGRSTGGIIALTTQVCEMSLDLDADVLITELAPIPSLIQRMGRCNRHAHDEVNLGVVYCYTPESTLPYNPAEVEPARAFLTSLDGQVVSQSRLEDELDARTRQDPRRADTWIQFVEGAPWAAGGEEDLRDSYDFTVDAILDADLEHVLSLRRRHQRCDGFVLPVPRRHASSDLRLGHALYVASTDHYDARFGFFQEPIHGPARRDLPDSLIVTYRLSELPTAQHKAGLAGLLLLIRNLEERKALGHPIGELPEIQDVSATQATFRFTLNALQSLFDDLYDAEFVQTKKGQDFPKPKGNFLKHWLAERHELWTKQLADALTSVIYSRPTTWNPFKERAVNRPVPSANELYKRLAEPLGKH